MTLDVNGRDLLDRLKNIARNGQTIDVAQIQFVGLDRVRAAYGDRWRVERDRIQEIARSFIGKRIQNEDVLIPCDNGFVIVFGVADSMDAALTAHSVGQALNQFFLGDEATRHFKVEVAHETLPVRGLSEFMNGMRGADPDKARRGDARQHAATEAASFHLQFQPVWDVKHEAITTYYAEPVDGRTGERIAGYQFEDGASVAPSLLQIDEAVLRTSEVAMRSMFEAGKKAIVGVPVHISSLVKLENRARILQTISQLDPALCKYRTIKLSGVVPGFPRLYLRETVGFLAAHIPNIVVSMSATTDDFSTVIDCEASMLAYTLPPGCRVVDDPAFFNKVRRDAAIARSRFKKVLVEGTLTAHQASVCARSGIDALASPLVWPPIQAPRGVLKWAASRLLPERPPC